ncbi:hypothetical protein HHL28_10775 [Aerophototrophica crusticola]|uniref:Spore coat protein U domain-containing protein n=1 Tax=Aerophototrophica crusticola TaxID=1709002 RepID=A0A858R7V3_9PROT|nr:hypothetical protein HHL28_10775 [Rhodospirillaceae bacterium B3]
MTLSRPALLSLVALAGLMSAGQVAAQGTVRLAGSVNPNCNLQVQDLGATLNITGGSTLVRVGSIREYCNDKDGLTLTFTSSNGGALVGESGFRAGYSISYAGTSNWQALSVPYVVTRNNKQTNEPWRDLYVSLPANAQAHAGSYRDTVTVTIAAR